MVIILFQEICFFQLFYIDNCTHWTSVSNDTYNIFIWYITVVTPYVVIISLSLASRWLPVVSVVTVVVVRWRKQDEVISTCIYNRLLLILWVRIHSSHRETLESRQQAYHHNHHHHRLKPHHQIINWLYRQMNLFVIFPHPSTRNQLVVWPRL